MISPNAGESHIKSPGPFIVRIHGLPDHLTWQDLKDLLHHVIPRSMWTEVTQFDGRGSVKTTRNEDAVELYRYLSSTNVFEGRRLHVLLWDCSDGNTAEFLQCNCDAHPNKHDNISQVARVDGDLIVRNAAACPTTVQPPPSYPVAWAMRPEQTLYPFPAQVKNLEQLYQHRAGLGLDPRYARNFIQGNQWGPLLTSIQLPRSPAEHFISYARGSNGAPVNTTRGYVLTERKAIVVSGIDFKAKEKEVLALFSNAGRITAGKLARDSQNKSKGTAFISYNTPEEAQKAINQFDGHRFMNMKLNVRLKKEQPARESQVDFNGQANSKEPLIVNGSFFEPASHQRNDSALYVV